MKKLDYVMAAVKTLVVKQWHGKKKLPPMNLLFS